MARKTRNDKGRPRKGIVTAETRRKQSEWRTIWWQQRSPKKIHEVIP